MNAFWTYFWPAIGVGLVFGILAGSLAFRVKIVRSKEHPKEPTLIARPRRQTVILLAGGIVAAIVAASLWHGPLGAAHRFTATIERQSREALDHYEMSKVSAHLHRAPLTRQLVFTDPGGLTDFQHSELVRLFSQLPGVHVASWSEQSQWLPLIVEAALTAISGFLLGLLVAYLVELRRRHNSQWNW
jgi:uncharacterized integral membrane protein